MILVVVLVMLGLIAALVIQAQVSALLALRLAERQSLQAQLRAAATEATWQALTRLAADNNLLIDHTNEPWAQTFMCALPNGIATRVQITDEQQFFDVNTLSAALPTNTTRFPVDIVRDLLALSRQPDPDGQAQTLNAWFHSGLETTYAATGNKLAAAMRARATAAMESPAELDGVLATPSTAPIPFTMLTVLPRRETDLMPVNVNSAGLDVLRGILGLSQSSLAEKICRLRDAGPLPALNRVIDPQRLPSVRAYLDTRSYFFSVQASAEKDLYTETIYALVRRDERGNVAILRWVCRS